MGSYFFFRLPVKRALGEMHRAQSGSQMRRRGGAAIRYATMSLQCMSLPSLYAMATLSMIFCVSRSVGRPILLIIHDSEHPPQNQIAIIESCGNCLEIAPKEHGFRSMKANWMMALGQMLSRQRTRHPPSTDESSGLDSAAGDSRCSQAHIPTDMAYNELAVRGLVTQRQTCGSDHEYYPVGVLNGHDPYAYLKDVLTRLPMQRASAVAELPPHRWQPV